MSDTYLEMSWGVSRGRETEGYNICRLVDTTTGKRYRCMGGGYDMQGTVFAEWLQDNYQAELLTIKERAYYYNREVNDQGLYGMRWNDSPIRGQSITLDGACGLDSIERIAKALGLKTRHLVNRKGHLNGMIVTDDGR